ncbi:MAG: squalene synthase HpnC [Bacteroidota bacterium]|jgi:phytoene synthase
MNENTVQIVKKHYENFPVGSLLLRKRYRQPIHRIYVFARVADDFADEGTMPSDERIKKLQEWEGHFHSAMEGKSEIPVLRGLGKSVREFDLPVSLFDDLMTAFKRDASNPIYPTFADVLEYCTYSANPIGRLLLKIFGCSNEQTERLSDNICTALQLTNFWQDISVDTRRNRFYIAHEEFERYQFSIADLSATNHNDRFLQYMKEKIDWTKQLFISGAPLFDLISPHFRFELKLTWHGGMRMLEKIEELNYDTRHQRPVLDWNDKLIIAYRALRT